MRPAPCQGPGRGRGEGFPVAKILGRRREPSNEEIKTARRQALAKLRSSHRKCIHLHDDLISAAVEYALGAWDVEHSFEALVTWKANNLALDHLRKKKRLREAVTSRAHRPATLEGLRSATLAECRDRLLAVTGSAGERWLMDIGAEPGPDGTREPSRGYITPAYVAELKRAGLAARKVLRALVDAPPEIVALVDLETLHHSACFADATWAGMAGRKIGVGFNADGLFGETATESAILSILAGHVPSMCVGMTAAEVIETEADTIRKGAAQREARNQREARKLET